MDKQSHINFPQIVCKWLKLLFLRYIFTVILLLIHLNFKQFSHRCSVKNLSKVIPMGFPLWGPHIIQENTMISQSKTTTNSNKTKWISTSLQAFKTKSNKGLKRIDISTRGKICVFRSFKTIKSSILNKKKSKFWGVTQDSMGQITYYLRKKTKRGRRKFISHLELFKQVQFVSFYIYMTCRLQKWIKLLQGSFVYIWVYQAWANTLVVLE